MRDILCNQSKGCILTWYNGRVSNGSKVVLMFHGLLSCKNSSSSRDLVSVWARTTVWIVDTFAGTDSSRENSSLRSNKKRSERKENEHLLAPRSWFKENV